MSKKIWFAISCYGLCDECDSRVLCYEEAPENWDSMSEEEKEEWAREQFFSQFSWNYGEE